MRLKACEYKQGFARPKQVGAYSFGLSCKYRGYLEKSEAGLGQVAPPNSVYA